MAAPYFFGYGSLVNLATHDYPDPVPATLRGWRRAWRHTGLRDVAFLSIVPDTSCDIEGMIAHVPNDDWASLDAREWAYQRLRATDAVQHTLDFDPDIAVYAVPETNWSPGSDAHPILLSYLDVVVQGYMTAFGPDGAARFFETTDGWDAPVLDDRNAPRYPRAQTLSEDEAAFVDDRLRRLGTRILPV